MRRYISYIYHYADGIYKCGNVGFCKVEQNGERRVVTLCVKDVKPLEGKCKVGFLKEGGQGKGPGRVYTRYPLTIELTMSGGIVNEKITVDEGDGLILQCGDRKYVVLWKSTEETICIVESEPKRDVEQAEDRLIEKRTIKEGAMVESLTEGKTTEVRQKEKNEKKSAERSDKAEYKRLYNRFCKSRMILEGAEYQVVKLKPQDIMWFPRCHWRLINNSLVMDGYYRYGHILFLQYDGEYVLAVPAIDSENTCTMAARCGFGKKIYGAEYSREDIKRPYWLKFL
ncbi:MAG: hypothetical protein IJV71_10815 [Lachnospiraceae bacterium]|nr:hypothetical protein [Lachnospiraceae bacterium]